MSLLPDMLANRTRLRPPPSDKHHRARPAAAAAERHAIAVAFDHADKLERHAEQIRQNLRISRRVTHAEVERAGDDRDRAIRFEMHRAELLAGSGGDFEVATDAEPAQQTALAAFALALVEARVVGGIQRLLEHAKEIAAVVS